MKLTRRLPITLALVSLPLLAWVGGAAADTYPRAKMDLKVKQYEVQLTDYTFPSGLRVIFQEDHSQPLVSITAVNARGSTADPDGKEGIAHVMEHLWFRSRHDDGQGGQLPKVWDLLKELGASLNAFTTADETVYMTVAPSKNIIPLLRLEGLRMRDPAAGVANDILLIEREVVRNELRLNWEEKDNAVFGYLQVNLFPQTHPYGKVAYGTIGNDESLNAITLDDIKNFARDHYGPELTTLQIVGDFSVADANTFLQEIGQDLMVDPKNPDAPITLVPPKPRVEGPGAEPPPVFKPAEVKGELTGVSKVRGAVDGPLVALGWSVPAGWRVEYDTMMQVAASQLAPAIADELFTNFEFGDPITSLGCGLQQQLLGSMVVCTIELKAGQDGMKTVDKALNGLYKVWEAPEGELMQRVTRAYFEYGRMQNQAFTLQSVDLIASLFTTRVTQAAMFTHYTGDLQFFKRQFDALGAVDPVQVTKFAEKYLNRTRAVAVVMEPLKDGDVNLDSSDAGYRGASRESSVETTVDIKALTNDVIQKTVTPPDTSKLIDTKLANGMRVVILPYSNGPLLQTQLIFEGGIQSFGLDKGAFGYAMTTNDSYQSIDALRLAGFDGQGFEAFNATFEMSSSAGNVPDALYVVRSRLDGMRADVNGRLDWADDQKADILDWMKKPEGWESTVRMERLMPGHAMSQWLDHGKIDEMKGWGPGVVEEQLQAVLKPQQATLVMVGNIDPKEAQEAAKTYLGNWAGWKPNPKNTLQPKLKHDPPPTPPARQVILFDKENTSQSEVSYQCQLNTITPENLPAAQVMADALSEGAWMALREQTGASYGAYTYIAPDTTGGPSFMYMGSTVQNDQAVLAVKSFLGLGEKAKAGKIDPDLITMQKYAIAQGYGLNQQSTGQMITRIAGVLKSGLGLEWFKVYPKRLAEVTQAQMPPLVERCVDHEVVTVVGPTVVLKPMFDAANVPVEVFDWKKARLDYAAKWKLKDVLKAEEKKQKEKEKGKK